MRKLAIGGRGLVRAETDSSGQLKFRKESEAETLGLGRGGGQYTDAQAYEESEFRIQQLSGAIKEGMGGGKARATRDRGASMASKAVTTMSKALADNAGDIQMAMEKADPKAKDEMKEFSKLLAARQKMTDSKIGGQDKEKAKELDIKIQKSKMRLEKFGEGTDLAQKLNLEQVGKDLESEQAMSTLGGFIPLNKTGLKDFAGVDSSTEGFMGGLKEAFDPNRLFGAGSGFAKLFGGKEKDAIQEQVDLEFAQQDQMEGFQDAIGEDLLQLTGEETKVTQENIDKNTDRAAVAQEELLKQATEEGSIYTHDTHVEDKLDQILANQMGGASGDTRTGLDTESIPQQQLDVLEEIRDILQGQAGGADAGGDEGGPGLLERGLDMYMDRKGKKGKRGRKGSRGRGRKGGRARARGKGGMLRNIASRGASMLGFGGGGGGGGARAAAGGAGKKGLLKGAGKGLLKGAAGLARAIPGVGLAVAAGSALFGGFTGARKAGENFGLAEGEKATAGQKIASGVGGAISGLTFGLVDGKKVANFLGGKDDRVALRELAEKDPEAAARVQASIDAGVDPDKALANEGVDTSSGLMKGLKFGAKVTTAPLRLLGKAGGAVMDMFKSDETKARDAARDEAKESGLYDRNFFGKSTIDSSKLGEASIEQLEAILHDDDLSEEDKEKVVAALEQKKIEKDKALVDAGLEPTEGTQGEAIETAGAPTGDAVAAGGDALAAAGAAAGQNVTVSNVQQMAGAMGGREKTEPVTAIVPGMLRTSSSTLHRYQDKRFRI